jgi:hypothetical protein
MRSRLFRRLLLAGAPAALLFVALPPASAVPRLSGLVTQSGVVTQPVRVTSDDKNPVRLYSAPDVAVDPANPLVMVTSFMDTRSGVCGIELSRDGGATWTRRTKASPDAYPICMNIQFDSKSNPVAFGRDGTLYQAFDGWAPSDGGWQNGNVSLFLARSHDLGQTWKVTTVRKARGLTGMNTENNGPLNALAVDSHSGSRDIVYVGFQSQLTGQQADQNNSAPEQPTIAVSTDGGDTFSAPYSLAQGAFASEPLRKEELVGSTTTSSVPPPPAGSLAAMPDQLGNFGGWGPQFAIDDHGTVYADWVAQWANISSPPTAHYLSRSTDHGKTWTHTRMTDLSYQVYLFVSGGLVWTPGGGSHGTLHAVYDDNPQPNVSSYGEVLYIKSTDGGVTWSKPRSLTAGGQNSAEYRGQFYGTLGVAPNGRLDLAWWDQRNDPGIQGYDVYYRSSFDHGDTWGPDVRVSAQTVSRRYGSWGNGFDMTSPPALTSTNDFAELAWDDTSLTDPTVPDNTTLGGGLQDIMTAAVQYHPVLVSGSNDNGFRVAVAAVIGLQVVAVALILLAVVGRRRTPRSPVPAG